MNTLELKSELYASESDDVVYFGSAIFVDGEAVADFNHYATILSELQQSAEGSGAYFLLTCSCGDPGCAGIYKGVRVVHTEKTVEWTIFQPPPQRAFIFDSDAYKRAVTEGLEQIRRDVADLWFTESGTIDEDLDFVPYMGQYKDLLWPKTQTKAAVEPDALPPSGSRPQKRSVRTKGKRRGR